MKHQVMLDMRSEVLGRFIVAYVIVAYVGDYGGTYLFVH